MATTQNQASSPPVAAAATATGDNVRPPNAIQSVYDSIMIDDETRVRIDFIGPVVSRHTQAITFVSPVSHLYTPECMAALRAYKEDFLAARQSSRRKGANDNTLVAVDKILYKSIVANFMLFLTKNVRRPSPDLPWRVMFNRAQKCDRPVPMDMVLLSYLSSCLANAASRQLVDTQIDVVRLSSWASSGRDILGQMLVRRYASEQNDVQIAYLKQQLSAAFVADQTIGLCSGPQMSHYNIAPLTSRFLQHETATKSELLVELRTCIERDLAAKPDCLKACRWLDRRCDPLMKQFNQNRTESPPSLNRSMQDLTDAVHRATIEEGAEFTIMHQLTAVHTFNKNIASFMVPDFEDSSKDGRNEINIWTGKSGTESLHAKVLTLDAHWVYNTPYVWLWFHLTAARLASIGAHTGMALLANLFSSVDNALQCSNCRTHFQRDAKLDAQCLSNPTENLEMFVIKTHASASENSLNRDSLPLSARDAEAMRNEYRQYWAS